MKAKFINESARYTEAMLQDLLSELGDEAGSDDEAFEIAQMLMNEEPGLEDYIRRSQGVRDPLGWLANRI